MLKLPIQEEHVSVRRTYLLLMKALLDLLAEMPFEKISLTDICRVSMVSRSTFYRYFEDKYDLVNWYFQSGITRFLVELSAYSSWIALLAAL